MADEILPRTKADWGTWAARWFMLIGSCATILIGVQVYNKVDKLTDWAIAQSLRTREVELDLLATKGHLADVRERLKELEKRK